MDDMNFRQYVTDSNGNLLDDGLVRNNGKTVNASDDILDYVSQSVKDNTLDNEPPKITEVQQSRGSNVGDTQGIQSLDRTIDDGRGFYEEQKTGDVEIDRYSAYSSDESVRNVQMAENAINQQVNIEAADFNSKMDATLDTWKNTYLSSAVNWMKNDLPHMFGEDEDWIKTQTTESINKLLTDNKIPLDYRPMIMAAKNQAHQDALIREASINVQKEKNINDYLSAYGGLITSEKTTATLGTSLLGDIDAPLILTPWVASKLPALTLTMNKAARVGQYVEKSGKEMSIYSREVGSYGRTDMGMPNSWNINMTKEVNLNPFKDSPTFSIPTIVASHTVAGAAAYEKDPNVSGAEAAIVTLASSAIDALVARRIMGEKNTVMNTMNTLKDAPSDDVLSMAHKSSATVNAETRNSNIYDKKAVESSIEKKILLDDGIESFEDVVDRINKKRASEPKDARTDANNALEAEMEQLLDIAEEVTKRGKPTAKATRAKERLDELKNDPRSIAEVRDDATRIYGDKKTKGEDVAEDIDQLLKDSKEVTRRGNPTAKAKEAEYKLREFSKKDRMFKDKVRKNADEVTTQQKITSLKNRIKNDKKMKNRDGFARMSALADSIRLSKKNADDIELAKEQQRVANEIEEQMLDLERFGAEINYDKNLFKNYFKNLADEAKDGVAGAIKGVKELTDKMNELFEYGFITKSELDSLQYALKNGTDNTKGKKIVLNFKMDKDGMLSPVSKNKKIKKKSKTKIAAGALAIVAGSSLTADEGGVISTESIGSVLGLLAVGAGVLFLARGGLSTLRNANELAKASIRSRGYRKTLEKVADHSRFGLFETLTPMLKDKDEKFKQLARDMFHDVMDGFERTMERDKSLMFGEFTKHVEGDQFLHYKDWIKENKVSLGSRIMNFGTMEGYRLKFEGMVADYIRYGDHAESAAVVKAGEAMKESFDKIWKEAEYVGVKGFDKEVKLENYMPRNVNTRELSMLLRSATEDGFNTFVDALTKTLRTDKDGKMVSEKQARIIANEYAKAIKNVNLSNKKFASIKEIQDYLDTNGITAIKAEDMASEFGIQDYRFGRTKERLSIEERLFPEGIAIETGDGMVTIGRRNVFSNNSIEQFLNYANQTTGHIALARKNYTYDSAMMAARGSASGNSSVMEKHIDLLVGNPIIDPTDATATLVRNIQNYTQAEKMIASAMSLVPEAMIITSHMTGEGFKVAMDGLVSQILKGGRTNNAVLDEVQRILGKGVHRFSAGFGSYRAINPETNMADGAAGIGGIGSGVSTMGEFFRDAILSNRLTGLSSWSDYFTGINLMNQLHHLRKIAVGEKTIPPHRMKAYGITPEFMEAMKKRLKLNDKGEMGSLNFDKWEKWEQLEFQKVMDNISIKTMQEKTWGATGSWTRGSTLGMVASSLLTFPMMAFSNHGLFGIKGMLNGDPRAYMETFMWFAGGYLAAKLRSEAFNRNYSEEELMMFALSSMPLNPLSVYEGMQNPAASDIMSITENWNNVSAMLK